MPDADETAAAQGRPEPAEPDVVLVDEATFASLVEDLAAPPVANARLRRRAAGPRVERC